MIRTTTISFGNANIGEVYRLPQQYVKQCSGPLQPESGPQKAGVDPVGKVGNSGDGLARRHRQPSPERRTPPFGRKRAQLDLLTVTGTHYRAQLADAVDQPAIQRHAPGQHVATEQGLVRGVDLAGAAAAHMLLEGTMDILLQRGEARDIRWVLGEKRVEQGFSLAGSIKAALDAEPTHQLGKAEARADDAYRAEERGFLTKDFVAGERQPITTRGRHILGERYDGNALLVGELANAPKQQCGLHRGSARRIDDEGDRDEIGDTKSPIDRRGMGFERDTTAPRTSHNNAVEAQHRNDRCARPQLIEVETLGDLHTIARWEGGLAPAIGSEIEPLPPRRPAPGGSGEAAVGLVQHQTGGEPRGCRDLLARTHQDAARVPPLPRPHREPYTIPEPPR